MAANRIRVSLSAGELEVEGSDEFISKYGDSIDIVLQRLQEGKTLPALDGNSSAGQTSNPKKPGEFGEALQAFSSSANDTDRMLLAGSFAQASSSDNAFVTGEAAKLLIEQGIKPGNPSQCMTNNLKAKRVFKVGSKYRVSKQGEDHLRTLGG